MSGSITDLTANDTLKNSGLAKLDVNMTTEAELKMEFCREVSQIAGQDESSSSSSSEAEAEEARAEVEDGFGFPWSRAPDYDEVEDGDGFPWTHPRYLIHASAWDD